MSKANSIGRRRLPMVVLLRLKKGACVGKTKRGKGTKWMGVADGQGLPLGNYLDSASPAKVGLIEPTLDRVAVPRPGRGRPRKNPTRLIYDKAADSDPLCTRLARRGIELICPHRKNRKKPPTQDKRPLRRYKRRWKVERTWHGGAIFDGWSCDGNITSKCIKPLSISPV